MLLLLFLFTLGNVGRCASCQGGGCSPVRRVAVGKCARPWTAVGKPPHNYLQRGRVSFNRSQHYRLSTQTGRRSTRSPCRYPHGAGPKVHTQCTPLHNALSLVLVVLGHAVCSGVVVVIVLLLRWQALFIDHLHGMRVALTQRCSKAATAARAAPPE